MTYPTSCPPLSEVSIFSNVTSVNLRAPDDCCVLFSRYSSLAVYPQILSLTERPLLAEPSRSRQLSSLPGLKKHWLSQQTATDPKQTDTIRHEHVDFSFKTTAASCGVHQPQLQSVRSQSDPKNLPLLPTLVHEHHSVCSPESAQTQQVFARTSSLSN